MKTVIVTGALGNLGKAVTKKFIAEGYMVIGTSIPGEEGIPDFSTDRFEQAIVDLMNEDTSARFVDTIIKKYKTIDAAVLTVGGFTMGTIADTATKDILNQYKLNFETAYNVARPVFAQMMKQNNGRLFFTGARPGLETQYGAGMTAYSLTKSLLVRLTELMNFEAKGHNVTANLVVPSIIDTPQNRKAMPKADFSSWAKPEDIANIIYYYCTEAASAIREPIIKVYNNA
ncbi:MAG TPA: SDR family NAD(P)-dependent oxidoreductase [Chitinophagaceae bacterium]|nr:SDR family NAD(P)-dependent oxidoreductase [Chitinophagaceae bacterium]